MASFSYAQAAMGRAPSAPSSKQSSTAVSGAATPSSNSVPELAPGSSWADDAEGHSSNTTVANKGADSQSPSSESSEKAVSNGDSKIVSAASSVDSPDMASSSASILKDDDASSVQNTSSETTWESKSQTSEPTLKSTESKESKTESDASDETAKQAPPPKPVLQEAKPPAVNVWAQRAQAFQSRNGTRHSIAAPETAAKRESGKSDVKGKANSVANIAQDSEQSRNAGKEWKKPAAHAARGGDEARASHFRQGSRSTWDSTVDGQKRGALKSNDADRQISPSSAPAPPPAANDVAWPTFESAREEEKRKAQEKEEKAEKTRDTAPVPKTHGKTEWKTVPYVPSAVFETAMPARGGRAGRGGGRGGSFAARGGFQAGTQGEKPTGRASSLPNGEPTTADLTEQVRADREAMPPPSSRSARTTSDGPAPRSVGNDLANGPVDPSSISIPEGAAASATEFVPSAPYSRYTVPKGNKSPRKDGAGKRADGSHESLGRSGPTQDVNGEPVLTNGVDGAHVKDLPNGGPRPTDGARDARDAQNFREPKPKRGRGNNRGFGNGHYAASHQHANGYPADYPNAGYGMPSSQPPFRGGHYSQQSRSGFRNNGMRSQSIALDSYGRPAAGYNGYPMPPVQTSYMPEYYGAYPTTAVPYQPAVDQQYLLAMVATQLEYYFSLENMVKDIYLRKHMDSQGFVFMSVIAQFNRIKQLTTDYELIRFVCLQSPNIEVRVGPDGKERLRKKEGWEKWVLPMNERDASAQNEGPEQVDRPEVPQLRMFEQQQPFYARGPASAGGHGSFSKVDRQMMNGMPPAFYPPGVEPGFGEAADEESRGRQVKSPYRDSNVSPFNGVPTLTEESGAEPDNFLAEQIQGLTVVTHKHDIAQPRIAVSRGINSRTFSNGSIDSRSIFEEMEKPEDKQVQLEVNGGGSANGVPSPTSSSDDSSQRAPPLEDVQFFWVKERDAPVNQLPNGSTHEPYPDLHTKALTARDSAATGTCPYDMDVLYQFWSHFLIRNFNTHMYHEFCHYAKQDAAERHNDVGLNNLLKFYEESLSSQTPIRDRIARDYVELAKSENAKSDRSAFKQLRSAWRNGALNLKNRKKLSDILDETFRVELES